MKKFYTLLAFLSMWIVSNAQNDCGTALPAAMGFNECGTVDGTLQTVQCTGGLNGAENAEWFYFIPEVDAYYTVSSYIPGYPTVDTRLSIYTGTCDALVCEGGDDDTGPGYTSIASMNLSAGVIYYLVWDNFWSSTGFTFNITEGPQVVNLVNFTSLAVNTSAMAVLDMNGDYLDDLVEPSGNNLEISFQNDDGTFTTETKTISGGVNYSPSWSICGGDLNGDGYSDLGYGGGSGVSIIWSQNEGADYVETSTTEYVFSQRSNMADINNDGMLDLFVCHDVAPNVFYLNQGNQTVDFNQGGMGDTSDGGNYGSVWIDYDNDCDYDMFIAKCRGGNSPANINQMHRNNGDGTFTEVGDETGLADNVQTWSSAWGDFDNDGDMDLLVGASSFTNGGHKLMINNGDGTFTDQTAGSGFDTFPSTGIEWAPADFNNDGWVDVFGAGNTIHINNGDLTFTPSSVTFGNGPMGDLNNDGFMDVVGGSTVHLNEGNDNNWIKFNTVGTSSNKNGIGARITIQTASGQQIRDVRSGEGFRYMSSLNAHFGIGTDTEIESVTVCWPSGITDYIENVPINGAFTIVEGENAVSVDEKASSSLSVYPNPTENVLAVSINGAKPANYTITDMYGKVVMQDRLVNGQINLEQLATGFYIISLNVEGRIMEQKFVKK